MQATLQFDPNQYTEKTLRLILAKAQEWRCTPAEVVTRLLDKLAEGNTKRQPVGK